MYQKLDPNKIVETLEKLERRVVERFPGAGLAKVGAELIAIARQTHERSEEIAKPDWRLRTLVGALLALGVVLLVMLGLSIFGNIEAENELFGTLQGIDSAFNILVLMGAALFFMVTLEERLKRRKALRALHELRSIIHVVDMHQLTKDPGSRNVKISAATESSPQRRLTAFELTRYLDYCSEMLSLASKLAALYAERISDAVVVDTVGDIERLTSNLSSKIWQKITMVQTLGGRDMPLPRHGPKAAVPATATPSTQAPPLADQPPKGLVP